jgi:hypothetical protein
MPIDPGTKFTFTFTKDGVMRLANNAQSLELLKALEKRPELLVILGEDPIPAPANFTEQCLKPDPGNKPTGCQNIQCPMSLKMRLTDPLYEDRMNMGSGEE